jgi:hypothetical protein
MPSILIDTIIDALAAYLAPFIAGVPIIRGQVNRVPMPQGAFVELTEILTVDLSVPYAGYDPVLNTAILHGPARIDIQVDFYGSSAGDYCKAAKTAFRTGWGFDAFPTDIKPLYMSDGNQSPLITGEQQYESRWTLTASMQYNPTVTVPQQFADALAVTVVNVERAYPA